MFDLGKMLGVVLFMLAAGAAQAQPLKIVQVNAPAVNCVFQTDCNIPVSDSTGVIALPFLVNPNTAWVQSRTYAGEAGAPGAGTTATNTASA